MILVAQDDRIELILQGLPEDEGRVRLTAFMNQLQKLSGALQKLDRESHDGKSASVFQIVELSYTNPTRVALQAKSIPPYRDTGRLVVERLKYVTDALIAGDSLSGFDAELLEDIRGLAAPVGRQIKTSTLVFNGAAFDLTPRVVQLVDVALAIEDECEGGLEGALDQINIHQGVNTFHVYPEIGPKRVTCHFPSKLLDDAVAAVGRRVEVFGTLKYRAQASFPHEIAVTSIEVFPSDDDLPDWDDLRGRAPDATGSLSSEAFIRGLRDAWD